VKGELANSAVAMAERAALGHVLAHDLVAALGHPRDVVQLPLGIEAQTDHADAQLAPHLLDLIQMLVHLGAGIVQVFKRGAGQLDLSTRL
jgi:hypothetical protein